MYNALTCAEMFKILQLVSTAFSWRNKRQDGPWNGVWRRRTHVSCMRRVTLTAPLLRMFVRRRVSQKISAYADIPMTYYYSKDRCLPPIFAWTEAFCRRSDTKHTLGIPEHVEFSRFSAEVGAEFRKYGDM
jgi:hypothetical protein